MSPPDTVCMLSADSKAAIARHHLLQAPAAYITCTGQHIRVSKWDRVPAHGTRTTSTLDTN